MGKHNCMDRSLTSLICVMQYCQCCLVDMEHTWNNEFSCHAGKSAMSLWTEYTCNSTCSLKPASNCGDIGYHHKYLHRLLTSLFDWSTQNGIDYTSGNEENWTNIWYYDIIILFTKDYHLIAVWMFWSVVNENDWLGTKMIIIHFKRSWKCINYKPW